MIKNLKVKLFDAEKIVSKRIIKNNFYLLKTIQTRIY